MNNTLRMEAGLGLKADHYAQALECEAKGLWFEVHPENYMIGGGPRLFWLEAIASSHPMSLHGVSLSLAADCRPDDLHLKRLKTLIDRVQPALVSEHLAWSAWRDQYHPDLLPFPRTSEALERIASNIHCTQEALGRCIAIENPTHYLTLEGHEWTEIDFLVELSKKTDCQLLLDVNNVHISAHNLGFSANAYLDAIPAQLITEIHLAGHTNDPGSSSLLIDSHDMPIAESVWALYQRLIERIGSRPTLIERDDRIPAFEELLQERDRAQTLLQGQREAAIA
ncbi:DUF692 domain-containing protein [Pseudomonas viridiflava]|uniref:MNIO family bufferin maturase n=1 Tax=Pseudomonas viridiflava TaxID=33069 RepID=UPI002A699213|nr:DUF692 domain-containing protein [Pseudomonas viridiflava]MDY0936625.1 DUF692 domain-containing protein [Pseudomonas viridiflava]MDY1012073.1 DUF692 domain-containing protein [Pseudomonas viridiflava]